MSTKRNSTSFASLSAMPPGRRVTTEGETAKADRLATASSTKKLTGALFVPLDMLMENSEQVRQVFDPQSLSELAADIAQRGVLEPLLVRQSETDPQGRYEIVAGARRYRAAREAGLSEVPVIVRDMNDRDSKFAMLVENVQRDNLEAEDERLFFERLKAEYNYSNSEIARLINKSDAYVSRRMTGQLVGQAPSKTEVSKDSEERNNHYAPKKLIKKSQSKPRHNTSSFTRFSHTLDETIEQFSQQPPAPGKSLDTLRQNVTEMEAKLQQLKKLLK